jgi:hypothetical protein
MVLASVRNDARYEVNPRNDRAGDEELVGINHIAHLRCSLYGLTSGA